ncbi:hypothetical protein NDU88_003124 [Pleurodeles waltl]|uniref:Uncharacterized protein n=1 Tax=Pleurodeles waltl TaxID=8319 RepID=A0AAV7PC59_PLEWA|nr:hypothetical protein NDU88_003124 [Pleurodeles waltl]
MELRTRVAGGQAGPPALETAEGADGWAQSYLQRRRPRLDIVKAAASVGPCREWEKATRAQAHLAEEVTTDGGDEQDNGIRSFGTEENNESVVPSIGSRNGSLSGSEMIFTSIRRSMELDDQLIFLEIEENKLPFQTRKLTVAKKRVKMG